MQSSGQTIRWIFAWLERQPRWLEILIAGISLLSVSLADEYLPSRISVSFFYLIPVLLAANTFGFGGGLITGAGAAFIERFILAAPGSEMMIDLWNTALRTGTFAICVILFIQTRQAFLNEHQLARQDFLTGLLNRRAFEERAAIEIERARRTGSPVAMLYIDCDDFKKVNDTYGHAGGDKVLQTIAATMNGSLRSTDAVARMGGDEFAGPLPDTNEPQARTAATNLHDSIAKSLAAAGFNCTCSLGIAVFVAPPETVGELIHQADTLMYSVKQGGKRSAQVDVFLGPG